MSRVLAKVIQLSQGIRSWQIIRRQPVLWLGLVLAALIVGFIITLQTAEAQGDLFSFTTVGNGLIWAFSQLFLAVARLMMSLTVFFLQLFIQLAAYNNFIDAPPVVIGWLMVRDVANMFFVVALLVIAFGTILGLEQYEWKKTLMKLILAAIFINFSKLILQLVIDVAHVFTTTFLNAIVTTAGGNLINMFHLDQVLKLTPKSLTGGNLADDLRLDLFIGALMSVIFSIMATVIIGAYLVVMLIRMVVLWVLIILSPLAFIAQVLPNTKSYAEEYWKEFTHHVIVAPVMVFFLWLTFATLGTGDISNVVAPNLSPDDATALASQSDLPLSSSISLSEATTWENFASFLIALGFLYVGLDRVQKLGVKGGGIVSSAVNFGKKVAAIATGYAAGRFLYEGASKFGKNILGTALYKAPIIGGEKWEQRAKIIGESIVGWYRGKGMAPTEEGRRIQDQIQAKAKSLEASTVEGQAALDKDIETLGKSREQVEKSSLPDAEKQQRLANIDRELTGARQAKDEGTKYMSEDGRERLGKEIEELEEKLSGEMGGGLIGGLARRGIQLEKQLEKTKKQADARREILWKRVGSEAGGNILKIPFTKKHLLSIGMGSKGLFGSGFMAETLHKEGTEAQDRIERGWLAAEKMRSEAKDKEFETKGKLEVLGQSRLKYDVNTGKFGYETFDKITGKPRGTMLDRITDHQMAGEHFENAIKKLEAETKIRIIADFERMPEEEREHLRQLKEELSNPNLTGEDRDHKQEELNKLKGKLWKTFTGIDYDEFLQGQGLAKVSSETLDALHKQHEEERVSEIYHKANELKTTADRLEAGVFADPAVRKIIKDKTDTLDLAQKAVTEHDSKAQDLRGQLQEITERRALVEKSDIESDKKKGVLADLDLEALTKRALLEGVGAVGADPELNNKLIAGLSSSRGRKGVELKRLNTLYRQLETAVSRGDQDEIKRIEQEAGGSKSVIADRMSQLASGMQEETASIKRIRQGDARGFLHDRVDMEIKDIKVEIDEPALQQEEQRLQQEINAINQRLQTATATNRPQLEMDLKLKQAEFDGKKNQNDYNRTRRGTYEALRNSIVSGQGWSTFAGSLAKTAEEKKIELKQSQKEVANEAEVLRSGGQEAIFLAQKKIAGLQGPGKEKLLKEWQGIQKTLQSGGVVGWQYAVAKATESDRSRLHKYRHNLLLSEAEQQVVWNKRGIKTPKSTLQELVEQMEKSFADMSYDEYVGNVGDMFKKFLERQESGEKINDADRASLIGLFKRGFKDSWVDDAIIGIMQNPETRQKIGRQLGWKNADFTPERIGQVEMLFASGGDVKFAERNAVFRELTDEIQHGKVGTSLNIDIAGLFEGVRTGAFKKKDGSLVSDAELQNLQQAVRAQANELGVEFNQEQEKLLSNMRNKVAGETTQIFTKMVEDRGKELEEYLQTMRDNQSAMQFFGNIRNEAIEKRHGENAGWSLSRDVGGGERMYIASGARAAMGHVYGDVNKTDVRVRAPAHSHMMYNLGVESGAQVLTSVREEHNGIMRNGIGDVRSWSGTPPRHVQLSIGVAAGETTSSYIDNKGLFQVGASKKVQSEWKSKHKWQYESAMRNKSEADKEKIAEALTAQYVVRNYASMMKQNMRDFLLTIAAGSGVSQQKAVSDGLMSLSIPRLLSDGSLGSPVHITNVSQLIDHLRKGTFGFRESSISPFNPTETTSDDFGLPLTA